MNRWYTLGTEPIGIDPTPETVIDLSGLAALTVDDLVPDREPRPADALFCHIALVSPRPDLGPASEGIPQRLNAWLSREHPASSYGQPVVILHDGTALGCGEVLSVEPVLSDTWKHPDETGAEYAARLAAHPTVRDAVAAGYPVVLP